MKWWRRWRTKRRRKLLGTPLPTNISLPDVVDVAGYIVEIDDD